MSEYEPSPRARYIKAKTYGAYDVLEEERAVPTRESNLSELYWMNLTPAERES